MCLGIPMRVIDVDGYAARCEARGVERTVSLFLMQGVAIGPGDYVMVHLGQVLQTMTEQEARDAWALYDQMLAAEGAQPSGLASGSTD